MTLKPLAPVWRPENAQAPSPDRMVARPSSSARRWSLVCRILGAIGVAVAGGIHFQLWTGAYGSLSVIGPLFLLDAVGSWVVALVLLGSRWPIVAAAGVAIELGAIAGLAISSTVGLFGFRETGVGTGGQILAAYTIEGLAAVLLGTSVILGRQRRAGSGEPASAASRPV